jgi:uncharacterized protein YjeT (DUF2065 family)
MKRIPLAVLWVLFTVLVATSIALLSVGIPEIWQEQYSARYTYTEKIVLSLIGGLLVLVGIIVPIWLYR